MEWLAQITGDSSDLEELSKSLNSTELCITKEEDVFLLKGKDFNSLKEADDVRKKAREIILLINGAARLAIGSRQPLTVAHIHRVHENGKRETFATATIAGTLRFRGSASVEVKEADGTVRKIHPADPVSSWVAAAQQDVNVRKVLQLLGTGTQDWVNLYRIYEVIESDVGGISNIKKEGGISEKMIKRFKRTANSPGAIGNDARHGTETTKPPKNPMSLSEAKSLISAILRNWLLSKGR